MQWFKLRPTFERLLPKDRQFYLDLLAAKCKQQNNPDLFLMHGEYGELHLPREQHRLWSPHLSFYVESRGDGAILYGRFAPRVDIWTSVWIAYLAMAFTAFFAFTLAFAQWVLSENAWGLWIGIASIAGILMLYAIAHTGQQWSVDQMHLLQDRLNLLIESAHVPDDPGSEGSPGAGIGDSNSSSPAPTSPLGSIG